MILLEDLRTQIESLPELSEFRNKFGLKVWVCPPWYLDVTVDSFRRTGAVLLQEIPGIRWPRLIKVGEIRGDRSLASKIPWTIGIGFLGQVMALDEEKFTTFSQLDDWPDDVESLTNREFKKRRTANKYHGLSLNQIIRMRGLYGSHVGVPLRRESDGQSFGCLTADTPYGVNLHSSAARKCGLKLWASSYQVAAAVNQIFGQLWD